MDQEERQRQKRLIMVYLFISLIIQVAILGVYYFGEKQTVLAFPMVLGIFITVTSIINFKRLD